MKKFRSIIVIFIFVLLGIGGVYLFRNREKPIEKILKTEAYSYLSNEAKEFVKEVYEESGTLIRTEKNKEENVPYLNPNYVEYLSLSDEEKGDNIPSAYSVDFSIQKTGGNLDDSYDLRDEFGEEYFSPRNQGDTGLCWAFTSNEQVEGLLLLQDVEETFSNRQLDYATSTNGIKDYTNEYGVRELKDGGNFIVSTMIMANGLSLVDENEMPFNDLSDKKELYEVLNYDNSLYELNETIMMPRISSDMIDPANTTKYAQFENIVETVKEFVMQYGGAYVGTQSPESSCASIYDGQYLIRVDDSCTRSDGHAMQIIGWNDEYEYKYCKNNGSHSSNINDCPSANLVSGTGAWILRNSWGSNKPYVYLAYDSIGDDIYFFTDVTDSGSWNNSYSTAIDPEGGDPLLTQTKTYTKPIASNPETVKFVKFFSYTQGTFSLSLASGDYTYEDIAEITVDYPGLHTIDVSAEEFVADGSDITVTLTSLDGNFMQDSISVFTSDYNFPRPAAFSGYWYEDLDNNVLGNPLVLEESTTDYSFRLYSRTRAVSSETVINYALLSIDLDYEDVTDLYLTGVEHKLIAKNDINSLLTISSEIPPGNYALRLLGDYDYVSCEYDVLEEFPVTIGSSITYYEVTFDANDGTNRYNTQRFADGVSGTLNANTFTRNGYAFNGWNTEPDGSGTSYADQATVTLTSGLTLYAQWIVATPSNCTITFNANGGTGTMSSQTVQCNTSVTLNANAFTKEDDDCIYGFLGWADNVNIDDAQIWYDYETFNTISLTSDITLYAIWDDYTDPGIGTFPHYSIEYYLDGGSVDGTNPVDYTSYTPAFTLINPTKEGYDFAGWTGSNGNTPQMTVKIKRGNQGNKTYTAHWTPKTVAVTFDCNGGTGGGTETYTYGVSGQHITAICEKTGYTLDGWKFNATDTNPDPKYAVNNNVSDEWILAHTPTKTLYAHWVVATPSNCTITFNANGGTGTMSSQTVQCNTSVTLNANAFTKEDDDCIYGFLGWADNVNIDDAQIWYDYETFNTISLTSDITLYAIWDDYTDPGIGTFPHYSIEYYLDGGSVDGTNPVDYTSYTPAFTLINPTKEGYDFAGWTGSNGNTPQMTVKIKRGNQGNKTYTAHWTPKTVAVTFDCNGGTGGGTETYTYGVSGQHITAICEKTGYTLDGWKFNATDTNPDPKYAVNNNVSDEWILAHTPTKTLYAHWVLDTYTIAYNLDGGSASGNPTSYTVESNAITLNNPTKSGYTFAGWTGSNGETPEIAVTIPKGSIGNKSYTANWIISGYTITYDLDGGSVTGNPTAYNSETETFTLINPTKDGYTFAGWTGSNGTTPETTVTITHGSTGNKSYTAHWTPVTYTITYDLAGGSVSTANPSSYTIESNAITLNNPTKEGYTFAGWTGSNGTTPEKPVTIAKGSTGNKSYTANWTPVTVVVTFDCNGGASDGEETYTYDVSGQHITATCTRAGYTLGGWKFEQDGTSADYDVDNAVSNDWILGHTPTETLYAHWVLDTYTITYDLAGGSASGNPTSYTVESNAITLINPTKENYDFAGWTGSNGETPEATVTIAKGSTGNKNYTAHWTPKSYTITYDLAGGSASGNPTSYTIESNDITLVAPTKDGYTFTGWTGSNGTTPETTVTITQGSAGNKSYTAHWTPVTYTITYDLAGGSVSTANPSSYTIESDAITLTNPTKEGYEFVGWTGSNGETPEKPVTIAKGSTGNKSYMANWTPKSYTITYDLDGGSASGNPASYTIESSAITLIDPIKEGYEFVGWTGSNGETTEKSVTIPTGSTGNKSYTAHWTPKTIVVTFNCNGGEGGGEETYTYDVNNQKIHTMCTKEHYVLSGWKFNQNGTEADYSVDNGVSNGWILEHAPAVTLYAHWVGEPLTITFDSNGGTGTMSSQQFVYGTSQALKTNSFQYTNFRFSGWNTKADGSGVSIADGETITFEADTTLYAQWIEILYYVHYDANGGTGEMTDTVVHPNESFNLKANEYVREGYNFVGWSTRANGSGTYYDVGQQISSISQDYTLYAQWQRITYKVTYNANGGTGTMANQIFDYSDTKALSKNIFTREGYTFQGWSTTVDGEVVYVDEATVGPLSGNMALYAQWSILTYTVTFDANGGTGTMNAQIFNYGESKNLVPNTYTRVGYSFNSWNTKAGGNGNYLSDEASVGPLNKNYTLYAIWSPISYYVAFDANGGTGTMSSQSFVYGTAQKLKANTFTKEGYYVTGWNTERDGSGQSYTKEEEILNLSTVSGSTITLYAQWAEVEDYMIEHYSVDDTNHYIDSIEPNTTVNTLLSHVTLHSGYRAVVSGASSGVISTGSVTNIYNGDELVVSFTNIVRGDVNGDGKISALDYVKIKNHIMGTNLITGYVYRSAADANSDNAISALDYVRIKNIIMNGGN